MTLILADCLPELRTMKTKSIDLILTDPPYRSRHLPIGQLHLSFFQAQALGQLRPLACDLPRNAARGMPPYILGW